MLNGTIVMCDSEYCEVMVKCSRNEKGNICYKDYQERGMGDRADQACTHPFKQPTSLCMAGCLWCDAGAEHLDAQKQHTQSGQLPAALGTVLFAAV